jgi:tRNA G26 N,N-dimethylase Trm1
MHTSPLVHSIDKLVVNDLEPAAVEAIRRNVEFNGLPVDRVLPHLGNAVHVMQQHPKHFHVVDLDPYGTAAPFMDGAVQAVRDGGRLIGVLALYVSILLTCAFATLSLGWYVHFYEALSLSLSCVACVGLLCVTCTDAAVLCGSYAEVAYANYGSFSMRVCAITVLCVECVPILGLFRLRRQLPSVM